MAVPLHSTAERNALKGSHGRSGLRLACTGFVSLEGGSVAVANGLLLQSLVEAGHEIDFFSKPAFVDPRPVVGERAGFRFVPVVNHWSDGLRSKVGSFPLFGVIAEMNDAACYNRQIVSSICDENLRRNYDLVLWMGDYAHGGVPGVPTVSFAQGPPGTDARSLIARGAEIRQLAGWVEAAKWRVLARIRLSTFGLPSIRHSDHLIVGSQQSRRTLGSLYGVAQSKISTLPYPIDLDLFKAESGKRKAQTGDQTLRVLWLGRIVPRKRLDLFLGGAALAIQQGIDVRLSIVGGTGFVRGYERLIESFPFPERLEWTREIARSEVPGLLRRHDVLAQSSDEENFGSSVAEAQACGLPVIVGRTNGNADYLCPRDIHLCDERTETFAAALTEMAARKKYGRWGEAAESRNLAEEKFGVKGVAAQLTEILQLMADRSRTSAVPA